MKYKSKILKEQASENKNKILFRDKVSREWGKKKGGGGGRSIKVAKWVPKMFSFWMFSISWGIWNDEINHPR